MTRTRIKVCGVTRPEDARFCAAAGVDAVGVIMVERSRRKVGIDAAQAIREEVDGLTALVLLVADPDPEWLRNALNHLRPDMIQFHGQETAEYCDAFGAPYLKALSWRAFSGDDLGRYRNARGFVVDSHDPGELGGTGKVFDWKHYPSDSKRPVLLAGGLSPENVFMAVRQARPYGVDVASGVETQPGTKSREAIIRFMQEVQRADTGSD